MARQFPDERPGHIHGAVHHPGRRQPVPDGDLAESDDHAELRHAEDDVLGLRPAAPAVGARDSWQRTIVITASGLLLLSSFGTKRP